MRLLTLLRHAAAGNTPGQPDHERPLTAEGRREAAGVAERLRQADVRPDLILSSTALRARQTLEAVSPALNDFEAWTEAELYLVASEALLERIRQLPDERRSVLVIGHNPGLQHLAAELVSATQDRERIAGRFPSAAMATVQVPAPSWEKVERAGGRLVALSFPA